MICKKVKTIISIALIVTALIVPAAASTTEARAGSGKTVRIGYFSEAGMMNGAEEGAVKSGYTYEYLQELASGAGWKYEYVYGSFSDLYKMFLMGEIDLLPYITITEERKRVMLFPDRPMGEERFYIASTTPGRLSDSLAEIEGKKVGTTRDAFHNALFEDLLIKKGVTCEIVPFDGSDERCEALAAGEIDYSIESDMVFPGMNLYDVYELDGAYPYYLVITSGREDLLDELNKAQKNLEDINPRFVDMIKQKYFKGVPIYREISAEGREWIEAHDVIRIGTFNRNEPYVIENEDGSFGGIAPEYLKIMMSELNIDIPIEWIFYDSKQLALKALYKEDIDLINPYYRNYNEAEAAGVVMSSEVYSSSMSILYEGGYTDKTMSVIATPNTRLGEGYVKDNYPDATIIPCADGYDCIEKLHSGEATCVILYTDALYKIAESYNRDYNIRQLNSRCSVCFAALPENAALISIINKGARFIGDLAVNEIENRYSAEKIKGVSAAEFFKTHPEYIWGAVTVLFGILLFWAVFRAGKDRAYAAKQKKLRQELERQKALVDYFVSSFSTAYTVDLTNDTFEILYMNKDFANNFGKGGSDKEVMKKFIREHIHPNDQEMMFRLIEKECIKAELKTKPSITFNVREVFGDVEKMMRGFVIRITDENHVAVGFMDITESVRKENEVRANLEEALSMAKSANRAKTAFLNNMSHDIRTPMNAIIGFAALAESHIDNKERVSDYLKKIGQSSEHLLSLINDVLDMSRIESGKMNIFEKQEDLFEIIRTLRDLVQVDMQKKQHSFCVDMINVTEKGIVCDKLRLNQVLLNVLSNSIKYTPDGGLISLCVAQDEVKPSGYATFVFTIEDNGMGMDEEFLKTVFEPFTRVKSSTVSGIQGTGLGMAITKNIVDMMGGRIEVKSEPGKGTQTRIVIDFKIWEENEEAKKAAGIEKESSMEELSAFSGMNSDYKGKRILLVEDNELNREIATEFLTGVGFTVETAEDGNVAVEKVKDAKAGDYDIIFMDVQMPKMDGYEATKIIRSFGTDISNVPIIAMTANAFEEDRIAALEAGMNEHIAKPIKVDQLRAVLEKYL